MTLGGKVIELWIDQLTAKLDGLPCLIDSGNRRVTPVVYKGRTMLPPRFVAESLNADVCWNAGERSVAVVYGTPVCFIPLCLAAGYPLTLVASQ
ncbi:MAG: copper amine oxidase N-terminal domain-containing protein [Bacillota bacterium]